MDAQTLTPIWPIVATMAFVAGARVHRARRRGALERALHELRRPLQALVLAIGMAPPSTRGPISQHLEGVVAAVVDLEGAVTGEGASLHPRAVACRALVSSAVERWRGPASRAGRSIALRWRAGAVNVMADPARVAQALDNLLANAIEHGALRVTVDVSLCLRGVRIAVSDSGLVGAPSRVRRRGHGLDVTRRVAAAHGGRFLFSHDGGGTRAVLELPLAPSPLPSPPIDAASRRPPARTGDRSAA